MLAIFRRRNFALFWPGYVISMIGDWMLMAALPFYVYQRTGSALATGAIYIVENMSALVFGSLAGVFVDRWDRRRTLIVAELLSALILLPLLFVQSQQSLWLVYVVAFVESVLAQFISSASGSLIPHLVTEEQLTSANSANAFAQELARLIGPTLGGFVLGLFGLANVILADSLSFFCCSLFIVFLSLSPEKSLIHSASHSATGEKATVLREWLAGLRLVRQEQLITILFVVASISMIGTGFAVIFIPFIHDVVHINAIAFGWILTTQGLGGIAGSLYNDRLSRIIPLPLLIAFSGILLGLFNFVIISFPILPVVLLVYLFGGGLVIIFFTGIYTLLQRSVSDTYRGRIFGMYSTTNAASLLLGMSLCSVLTISLSLKLLFGLMGAFYFMAGIAALGMLHAIRRIRPSTHIKHT